MLRDGRRQAVAAESLVPGDLVWVESGDKVPADLRLMEVKNLQVQEAALTGESVPVEKNTEPVEASAALGDRTACCTPERWSPPAAARASSSPPATTPKSAGSAQC